MSLAFNSPKKRINQCSTDPSSFDIYLVNNAVYPNVDKKIASDVDASDGSYTVDGLSGLTDGYTSIKPLERLRK
jgi:hypothetical protein